ncbi:hypothetical protein MPH47_17275 [Psychrobacillus psychrodurans]|uniref:hypothetical protein n=1 Tax=Psychrobacillus psychrodurans TaxID=126157 RepID=UPI001F4EA089|nr:hypothetical protein [Psychrobacillus psychrodurans]MCK1998950.1 hypothetical protein [Psychrobacillus psychrodurans]
MLNINLPVELESMELIQLIESPVVENLGILIMGEDMNGIPNIRFYELENIENVFEVKKELQTFTFLSSADAMTFVDHLPDMSALELILMMRTDNKNKILQ